VLFSQLPRATILKSCSRLLALGLELPEDALVNLHGFSSVGETYGNWLMLLARASVHKPFFESQIHEIVGPFPGM
jgi:hypothetical protein